MTENQTPKDENSQETYEQWQVRNCFKKIDSNIGHKIIMSLIQPQILKKQPRRQYLDKYASKLETKIVTKIKTTVSYPVFGFSQTLKPFHQLYK